jgi:hypothetical protein
MYMLNVMYSIKETHILIYPDVNLKQKQSSMKTNTEDLEASRKK